MTTAVTHRLNELRRTSSRIGIADAVRDAIFVGRFRPDAEIPKRQLAEELGMSRTPSVFEGANRDTHPR